MVYMFYMVLLCIGVLRIFWLSVLFCDKGTFYICVSSAWQRLTSESFWKLMMWSIYFVFWGYFLNSFIADEALSVWTLPWEKAYCIVCMMSKRLIFLWSLSNVQWQQVSAQSCAFCGELKLANISYSSKWYSLNLLS